MKHLTKKTSLKVVGLCMCGAMLVAAGCSPANAIPEDVPRTPYSGANKTYTDDLVQGVSVENGVTTIKIGNTAATTGAFATVGVPFNYGLEAWLWTYEQTHPVKFEFVHYDDEFDGTKGKTYTQTLVETDNVFALVGHFGTNTIEATCDYITTKGVPMVYAATGVNSLYMEDATGFERAIMSVQPIYKTEGRSMLATAVAPTTNGVGLGGTNIGVIYTSDDAGISMAVGIKAEAEELGVDVYYQCVDAAATDYSSAVNALKRKGCDVAIIASAQAAFSSIAEQFVASTYEDVKILTSYVSANGVTMGALAEAGVTTENRELYAGAWLDIVDSEGLLGLSGEYMEFAGVLNLYETYTSHKEDYAAYIASVIAGAADISLVSTSPYVANSYAMAGYVAAFTFTQGLDRLLNYDVNTFSYTWSKDLNWKNYIEAMEAEPVKVALTQGATIDFSNGSRVGVTSLSLSKYTTEDASAGGTVVRKLTSLADIVKTIG